MHRLLKRIICMLLIMSAAFTVSCGGSNIGSGSENERNTSSDGGSAAEKSITVDIPEDGILKIYSDDVREYLKADFDASYNLAASATAGTDAQQSILYFRGDYCKHFVVRVSEYEDFGIYFDRDVYELRKKEVYSVNLRTLIPGRKYYVKVFDYKDENVCSNVVSFTAEDLTVRTLNILDSSFKGTRNFRDSGGYKSINGEKVLYGMIYRGGYLNLRTGTSDNNSLTETGRKIMRDELGIKTEIDLRTSGWDDVMSGDSDKTPQTVNYIDSSLPYRKCTITQYDYIFKDSRSKQSIKEIFSILADKNSYPVYIHCNAGADRTGTIYTLIHGILGVSEENAVRDFELTSFSTMGKRLRDEEQQNDSSNYVAYGRFLNKLKAYSESNDFNDGVENYLKTLGVTEEEIQSIRTILLTAGTEIV